MSFGMYNDTTNNEIVTVKLKVIVRKYCSSLSLDVFITSGNTKKRCIKVK